MFKFRSGTHGLNEELGRHRGREGRKECLLCDAECESVSHVLWDCPAYASIRSAFMLELRRELGDRFEHFQSLDSFEKSSYVLGSEAWEEYLTLGAHARGLRYLSCVCVCVSVCLSVPGIAASAHVYTCNQR